MRTIFWNVDTQIDFMLPYGALYIKGAELLIPNLKKLTDFAKKHNIDVVNTADYHMSNSSEISSSPDWKTTFPAHCLAGSENSEFVDATAPQKQKRESYYIVNWSDKDINKPNLLKARNIIIYKDKFNVFDGNPHTWDVVNLLKPNTVVVYGVAGDVCVDFAVMELARKNYTVFVVKDAIQLLNNAGWNSLKDKWETKGVRLVDTDELPLVIK